LAVGEAVLCLAVARVAVLALPFRVIQRVAGARALASPGRGREPAEALHRISWAISAASRRVPWRSMCLEQALAGLVMLGRRRIPGTLYIGVRHEGHGTVRSVQAHAWLRSGSTYVTGDRDGDSFAVLSRIGVI